MLRPSFELVRIIKVQYSFVYIVQMKKRKKEKQQTEKTQTLCYERTDTTFQNSLSEIRWMLRSPWTWDSVKQLPGDTLKREVVSDLGSWKPRHKVVGWPAPVIKKSERRLVKVINASCFRCLKLSQISYGLCPKPLSSREENVFHLPLGVVSGGAVLVLPFWAPPQSPRDYQSPRDSHAL